MNNEEIEEGVFEEIVDHEREVISIKDLSIEECDKLTKQLEESEMAPMSPEDAAAFAKEMEEAQKEIKVIQTPDTKEDRPLSQVEMIQAVKSAVKQGVLSKSRKEKMLRDMGIFKSTFTKKAASKPAAAKKRKAAKKARRKNRK